MLVNFLCNDISTFIRLKYKEVEYFLFAVLGYMNRLSRAKILFVL